MRITINHMKGICPSTPPLTGAADVRVATAASFVWLRKPGSSG
ncbi:MAG TPA: hypothetical protein VFB85_01880 [Vicinamibacterales bacterium]|nr:hypothetical protein [Vicinamibacterales bacterium]